MERTAAASLINSTFAHEFNRERFTDFIRNLLKKFEEKQLPGGRIRTGNYIYEPYRDLVESLDRVGKYTDVEGRSLEVLVVKLKPGQPIDRARTKQRNYAAYYLEHGRDDGSLRDAALVAFVEAGGRSWRFSLVRMEYELKQTESGKVRSEKTLSPARRFSFLVGEGENTHTARIRFVPLLEDDSKPPTLEEINQAFSVEAITDEFFEQYREIYLQVRDELEALAKKDSIIQEEFREKGISVEDFAKKLLGQIVFLYFLQRKGWLGVAERNKWGTGPRDFLRQLFDKKYCNYNNFFNDVLEYLFYDMLAVDKGEKAWHEKFNCRIPFLNGGLFEPLFDYDWRKTNVLIPNQLFSNRRSATDFDAGAGILDVFDRYNFTVREDEPLEKEVAVDPELLGKVFENLLEVKDRKSKGSYYTPREIVHYMCQESLLSYLDSNLKGQVSRSDLTELIRFGDIKSVNDANVISKDGKSSKYILQVPLAVVQNAGAIDSLLGTVKVCDPAVGSGAFALGMLNEIVRARYNLNPSLFGQLDGIDGRGLYELKWHAIEDCIYGVDIDPGAVEIAKLRLWLSLIVDEETIENVNPLPNLDFKIMQGNSLLETFEGTKLFDESAVTRATKKRGGQIVLAPWGEKQKEQLDLELGGRSHLVNEFRRIQHEYFKASHKSDKERLIQKLEHVEDRLIETTLSEQKKADAKALLDEYRRTHFKPYFLWRLNFGEVFQDRRGFDVVIANPPYGVVYDNKTKPQYEARFNAFKRNNDIFVGFFSLADELLKADHGVLCFITPNTYLNGDYFKKLRELLKTRFLLRLLWDFKNFPVFNDPTVYVAILLAQHANPSFPYNLTHLASIDALLSPNTSHITIDAPDEAELKNLDPMMEFLASSTVPLETHFKVKDVGFNYWTEGRGKVRGNSIGSRVLYEGNRKDSKDIPYIKGRDINPFSIGSPTHFLRFDWEKRINPDVDTFRYSEDIMRASPKVVYRQTSSSLIAAVDDSGVFNDKTVHIIIPKQRWFLSADVIAMLLNSSFLNYLYTHISQETAGRAFAQVKTVYVKSLPLPTSAPNKEVLNMAKHLRTVGCLSPDDFSRMNSLVLDWYAVPEDLRRLVAGQH